MASTYTTSLGIEQPASGEQDGTWGNTENTNKDLLEEAICGVLQHTMPDSEDTLTSTQGATNEARHAVIVLSGALTAARNLVVPAVEKLYIVDNSTTGGYDVTVKTSVGTGVAVPAGARVLCFCNGTNFYALNHLISPTFGALSATSISLSGSVDSATKATTKTYVDALADDVRITLSSHNVALGSSIVIDSYVAPETVTLPADLTGSYARAAAASTGTATFTIKINGVSVGSIIFTSSATATFSFSSQQVMSAGDVLTVEAPSSADATLIGLSVNLVASRTIA